ncbi:MATE family efflux transporter [Vibrio breoganii]|uniref:MATE family efflux transporter n=1 Tax=Vibrio breoganii TaxID=553239 RepID=UPI0012FFD6A9|nr:MATE family efflux transporter [Vibrio breoganii]
MWFVENKLSIAEGKIDTSYWVYQLAVLSLIFAILTSPFDALLFAFEKFKVYAIFGIVSIILKLLMVIILKTIYFDKLIAYSFIILLNYMFLFLMSCVYCFKTKVIKKITIEWDKSIFKNLLSFTGWSLFGNFSSVLYNQGVTVLLNIFFGPTVNAARGVATQVNSAVLSFSSSINSALAPRIVKKYSTEDKNEMMEIAFLGSKYSFIILTLLSTPVLLFTKELLNIWLTIVPDYTIIFVQLIILDTLVNGYSGTLKSSVQATGKIKAYQIVVGSMLLLNLPLSYLSLVVYESPMLPYVVGIFLSFIAFNARIYFMKRYFDVSFRKFYSNVVLPTLLPFITAIFFIFLVKERYGSDFAPFLIVLMFYFVYMSITWSFTISDREKMYIISTIKKIRKIY